MSKNKMPIEEVLPYAEELIDKLRPHCERVEIAGSIRRKRDIVGDIEIVLEPKPFQVGLFASGIATVIGDWKTVRGQLPNCKYTQRIHPEIDIPVDFFMATHGNFGLIMAIRTGSADFSHKVLARKWSSMGFESKDGWLHRKRDGSEIAIPEEEDLFRLLGMEYIEPKLREYNGD